MGRVDVKSPNGYMQASVVVDFHPIGAALFRYTDGWGIELLDGLPPTETFREVFE